MLSHVIRLPGTRGRPGSAALSFLLVLALTVAGCGGDDSDDSDGSGAPPESMHEPVNTLQLGRMAVDLVAYNLDHDRGFDRAWSYDAGEQAWRKQDTSRQSMNVVGLHGRTTQLIWESRIQYTLWLTRHAAPVQDLLQADHARLSLVLTRWHDAIDTTFVLEDPYDLNLVLEGQFRVGEGRPDTLVVAGTMSGESTKAVEGVPRSFRYGGTVEFAFDFPGQYDACAAERMTADVSIRDNSLTEIDRYSGSVQVAAGGPLYEGSLVSGKGDGRVVIRTGRSCP